MININSYFEIDWDATMKNLKILLLECTSYPVLAEAFHVETKTISNWLNNKTKPDLSVLITFARFLNMDLLDVIITKGDNLLTEETVHAAINEAHNAKSQSKQHAKDCSCPEDFVSAVLLHEYYAQKAPIRHLNEFLIYLPLFNLNIFQDVFYRLQGNLKSNQLYVLKQLRYLYDYISDSPAKRYADAYCYYYLTNPTVCRFMVPKGELEKEKWLQYLDWVDSPETQDAEDNYKAACRIFQNKLIAYDSLKQLLERITEDDHL